MYSWWDIIQTSLKKYSEWQCIEFFTYTIAPTPSHIFRNNKVPFLVWIEKNWECIQQGGDSQKELVEQSEPQGTQGNLEGHMFSEDTSVYIHEHTSISKPEHSCT